MADTENFEKFGKNQKKSLTNLDKSFKIWQQLQIRAQSINYGHFMCKIIVQRGNITEIQHWPARESIRADE